MSDDPSGSGCAAGRRYVYGPVFSRRLGRSLGVDLVPFKVCTYDCIYCQLGRTTHHTVARWDYVSVRAVLAEVEAALATGPAPDVIGLAGSGEPTLNRRLGEIIAKIKERTAVPVAVLTNGSLLSQAWVRADLARADIVLPSLDAADADQFQLVNRPHRALHFETMVQGLAEFTRSFHGEVWLECLLLAGLTDDSDTVTRLARWVERIGPARVQLSTLARPGTEARARAVPRQRLVEHTRRFGSAQVEVVGGRDDDSQRDGALAGPADGPILALLNRRPCTVADMAAGLGMAAPAVNKCLDGLLAKGVVEVVQSPGGVFYRPVRQTAQD